jgi:hypothetical protein
MDTAKKREKFTKMNLFFFTGSLRAMKMQRTNASDCIEYARNAGTVT